jgi:hypothetical protein
MKSIEPTLRFASRDRQLFRFSFAVVFCQLWFMAAVSASEINSGVGKDWPVVSGDTTNQRYSSLDRINLQTVKRLGGAWKSAFFQDGASSRSTPVVHEGVMFVKRAFMPSMPRTASYFEPGFRMSIRLRG